MRSLVMSVSGFKQNLISDNAVSVESKVCCFAFD
jgi:hypothetical protein